jgi:DNA-binding HxlR family transcriptional regulator
METVSEQGRLAINELIVASCEASRRSVGRTLHILDGKWTTLIVRSLLAGPLRFGELRAALTGPADGSPSGIVSAKTLTDRLRALEHQDILTRTVHPEIPPRVVYELTAQGHSLWTVLYAMHQWGNQHPAQVS